MDPVVRIGAAPRVLDNDVRTGWLYSVAAAIGVRIDERIDVRAEARFERSRADRAQPLVRGISGAAYDLDSAALSLVADYMLTRATVVSFGYTYRNGDVVSSTRRNRAIFGVSDAIARDPAFGPDIVAYRLDAHSHVVEARVSHALGERTSANIGVGRSFTYGDGGNNYYGTSVTASLLYNF